MSDCRIDTKDLSCYANIGMLLKEEKGQILIVVILVVIVTLTVGLSLATRTIINLSTSTEEVQAQKALNAAEAGIERSLESNTSISDSLTDTSGNIVSEYATAVDPVGGGPGDSSMVLNGGNNVQKNEGIDVWFEGHDASGNLDGNYTSFVPLSSLSLYWGSSGQSCGGSNKPAAIQVIAITAVTASPTTKKTYRYAYDACSATRRNNFTTANVGTYNIDGTTFVNRTSSSNLASGIPAATERIVFMRVIPIYSDTTIGITNDISLPSQGYVIDSTGISGEANRKVRVFKSWPQLYLPYISYGLFIAD